MVAPFEDRVDEPPRRPEREDLEVRLPDGRELAEQALDHGGLVAVGDPGAATRIQADADVRAHGRCDRNERFQAGLCRAGLDAGQVGSIDPRLLGDSGLAGGCIDPDPPNVVTDPADERPQSLLDQPIDRWASDRHEDIQHERALPGLICPVW
jgi:hypothetical protein